MCFPSGLLTRKRYNSTLLAFVKIGEAAGCLAGQRCFVGCMAEEPVLRLLWPPFWVICCILMCWSRVLGSWCHFYSDSGPSWSCWTARVCVCCQLSAFKVLDWTKIVSYWDNVTACKSSLRWTRNADQLENGALVVKGLLACYPCHAG